jgi:methionine-gamma-lyase
MAAISSTVLQICGKGDEIISSRTIYGGTYALFKNFLPRLGIKVHFVNMLDTNAIKSAISKRTRLIFCESISNPLMEVADVPKLRKIANKYGIKLVVDNTFSPMIISPLRLGADVVIHSLTKFINGTSDCVAGCVCSNNEFIHRLTDINDGASMLLGPVLDSYRAASILKNLHTLHIRLQKHGNNALYVAKQFEKLGIMNPGFGFGGMLAVDVGNQHDADQLMTKMQEEKVGYLAVSLGYFKTLFTSPSSSTASEISKEEQEKLGLSDGLIRISVGIDHDIKRSFKRIVRCLKLLDLV